MNIPLFTTEEETKLLKEEILNEVERVIDSGKFIMGPDVTEFENEVSTYLGIKHAIGVNSGTDALVIGLKAAGIGVGDEVITTSFTFFATAEAISQVGAKPVFVDVEEDSYNIDVSLIEKQVNENTKAVIPVHLYGHAVDMDPLMNIADKYDLKIVEDVAQAFGSDYKGSKVGTIGDVGCFSFFPTKNLGAYGDGGLITTNSDEIAEIAKMLRVHGSKKKYHNEILGFNSRLDSIQAAILRVKLRRIDEWNEGRKRVANKYIEILDGNENVVLPKSKYYTNHVFHQFTIRVKNGMRDSLQNHLKDEGISTMIYYPVPVHELPLYNHDINLPITNKLKDDALSLPIYPHMSDEIVEKVVSKIINYLRSDSYV
ncbi:DegT/DnrJ/EryC1/StrS family aminotransferase [Aquisalibacillus elongatus]|uniref:dTDP-4-amino-4,6-dideoxygalactose transaminase n=1 Tax=Aquisalibacillus elongatus TaxID=485577 RepID=A0A3N5CBJ4_9BACI|nr:DegT/DnrJ/EryC1/StrS family aminotransferase [Aquisalibacillus elongatus]RPF54211.1 dTDP-4-amino-4,6-dideoxygalactose transaminase [Aquisalibacillus elongatus]